MAFEQVSQVSEGQHLGQPQQVQVQEGDHMRDV